MEDNHIVMEIEKANYIFENESEQMALHKLLQQLSVTQEELGAVENVETHNDSEDSDSG